MKVLGLITARGGSKGIPRKNIKPIAGRPLIAWTIEAAVQASRVTSVVVSTDDDEIAECARSYGAKVPFRRPSELASDVAPSIGPVIHALQNCPGYDAVVLLQPTSPLRSANDIDSCIELAERSGATTAVSVCPADRHPALCYRMNQESRLTPVIQSDNSVRRQDLPAVFCLNGAVYFARSHTILGGGALVTSETLAYAMPPERSIDIDTYLDWRIAEMLLREKDAGKL